MSSRDTDSRAPNEALVGWSAIALIVLAVLIGGGGASALPHLDAACQFAGFVVIALLVATGGQWRIDPAARAWLVLAALAFLLPLAQLLPLPAGFAAGLPGRELANDIRAQAGPQGYLPLTLDPDQTIISALSLVPGIAAFAVTLRCSARWRRRALTAWIAMAMLAFVVGGLQVASSGTFAEIYDTPHRLAATGFFANRNHHSLFMLVVLVLATAAIFVRGRREEPALEVLRYALLLGLAAGILIAASRAGLLLLLVSFPVLFLLIGRGNIGLKVNWRHAAGGAFAVMFALVVFLSLNPVARQVLDRFTFGQDARLQFWPDVVYTARRFWPAGTGIGTFPSVYATQERLGAIDEYRVNHAHNDYLELAIEGGIAAIALVAVFIALFLLRLKAVAGLSGEMRRMALAAGFGIVLIMAHSLVDYPLRAITMMVMFGFLAGLLFRPAQALRGRETT
ncbi:O-antigen ligase family protein [Novosphingobium album (ex Liu et al. 2023)]|uniref:O-antigen ligase family protein n=1 Tax=Novosphingobium album (ex Liu et al. 2023) TaxID=3031130 RepID=A0ABT5WKA9_9SPHN|nr:O-antigen ligase family protein [Novosphingobium album (ex Liu et al. 2023)]MDE8650478.1 O-antigen ligase family protein [Novosphingobium album (ex Liu et al. 2023)]